MKVIDLLNKITNGEEVPKKIRYDYKDYVYEDNYEDYYCEEESRYLFETIVTDENWKLSYAMNIKVEIIEENKIPEKLDISNGISVVNCAYKINEIIDYLKSKGE